MYINPFVAGILTTIICEVLLLIIYVVYYTINHKK